MIDVSVVSLLCLVSVSLSAPLTCEDLIRPLDQLDPRHLEGRWALVAGSMKDAASLEFFKRRDSASVKFSNTNETSNISYTPTICFPDRHQKSYNVSVQGSSLTFDARDQVNLTVTFLYTSCPDCILMRFDTESGTTLRVYLFSRRREVEQKEMEEVRAQVECLQMLPPAVMDPSKEFCPEQSITEAQTEEKTEKQKD